ncbi:MAG TPA: exodeoxyribonuclease VII small subunit [Candidatus Caccovicinus merdipullorum]|uniref:Exodeoxyribonuclease 7 small subunit n=1 Tax=Candidatus Caccovicinus merdipullorum TaxID=2840724 RepID=A0A9D1KFB4_9FIRM|nr:exodeoxyribonuclease VII small subunit [Candidatus Caccovicinus merdipullorum]
MEEKEERREGADQETVLTIEESFAELENILEQLESSESSLEESFRWFEKGMKLVKSCSDQIDQVEKKIIVLSEGEDNAGI